MKVETKKRIAIFASGAGSNAEKIIEHFKNSLTADVALIVCNNPRAGVIDIAQRKNIPCTIISKKEFLHPDFTDLLHHQEIDLIVLAGFLWKIPDALIQHFPGRIINIHPALLPKFGGKGMYGMAVHHAVIAAKEKYSGITIHFVDEEYDHGNIIFQERVELANDENPESLAAKIRQLEHHWYPKTIEQLIESYE